MGDVIGFVSRRDERIARELSGYLPEQPALVAYLDHALRANRGTLFTARRIGEMLAADSDHTRIVSRSAVDRLGVHEDVESMERLVGPLTKVRPDALEKDAVVLRIRLRYRTEQIPRGITLQALDGMKIPPPRGSNPNADDLITYMRIYLCALAMLAGVTIDPRGQIDSHATG